MNGLLEKLDNNLTWCVLEINAGNKKNPQKFINQIKEDINISGYDVLAIFESPKKKYLYHIHIQNKGEA